MSVSPSPSSSILSSCSPMTFSPIQNAFLDTFEPSSPPMSPLMQSSPLPQAPSPIQVKPPNHHHRVKQRTLFEKLYTKSGFSTARAWYEHNTSPAFMMSEAQFTLLLRHLTDLASIAALDLFDALDKDDVGVIGFEEFFLVVALFAARECGQTTKFLYKHSRAMFEMAGAVAWDPGHQINFNRFAKFGSLVGIPEYQILNSLERFGIVIFDQINFELFQLFYFVILDEWDRSSYPFAKGLFYDPDYFESVVRMESIATEDEPTNNEHQNPDSSSDREDSKQSDFSEDFIRWLDSIKIADPERRHYIKEQLRDHQIYDFDSAAVVPKDQWRHILKKVNVQREFLKILADKLASISVTERHPQIPKLKPPPLAKKKSLFSFK
eukprot:gene7007-8140_t